jgi:hypothetical protein
LTVITITDTKTGEETKKERVGIKDHKKQRSNSKKKATRLGFEI